MNPALFTIVVIVVSTNMVYGIFECRNLRPLTDDLKVCGDWWTTATKAYSVRDNDAVKRCVTKILERCPNVVGKEMTAGTQKNNRRKLFIRVDVKLINSNSKVVYRYVKGSNICHGYSGMTPEAMCEYFKKVVTLIDWSEKEKNNCNKYIKSYNCQ